MDYANATAALLVSMALTGELIPDTWARRVVVDNLLRLTYARLGVFA